MADQASRSSVISKLVRILAGVLSIYHFVEAAQESSKDNCLKAAESLAFALLFGLLALAAEESRRRWVQILVGSAVVLAAATFIIVRLLH